MPMKPQEMPTRSATRPTWLITEMAYEKLASRFDSFGSKPIHPAGRILRPLDPPPSPIHAVFDQVVDYRRLGEG